MRRGATGTTLWLLCIEIWSCLVAAVQPTLTCPLAIPPATLTMACGSTCPNALSPCLYYSKASDCVAEADSGSTCVSSAQTSGNCAIECFSPFSGDAWNLMVTDAAEYKKDVIDRRAQDPSFRLAKKPLTSLASIRDLAFPTTTKTISISGNALPIIDKAVDYPVIYHGFSVNVDMGNFSFLENAQDATTIILENVNLTALSKFPLLPKLTTLQLSNGKLRAIPTGIAALRALQRLELSLNSLITVPPGALPTTLVDLCLQDCEIEEFPSGIVNMTSLRKLDLSGNKFGLPPVGSLPLQVEHLIWWGFCHKVLPTDFPNMTKLKKLEIGWNDFSNASALALLPTSLEEVHLISVTLAEIPPSFTTLKNLAWIEAGLNNVKSVTKNTLPPNLKFFNLSINLVSEIQNGALPSCLETLDLRLNKLECQSFPTDFATLTDLKALYLHENYLSCMPPGLFGFSKLETLTLHGNRNISRLTFNTSELAFLSKLKTFKIDQECLETSCSAPSTIGGTNYTVCLKGDTTIRTDTSGSGNGSTTKSGGGSSASNRSLIIGLAAAIGGLIVILIGAVHWKRRRDSANGVRHHPGDGGKGGLRPVTPSELYAIEEERSDLDGASDATSYAEMTHMEAHRKSGRSSVTGVVSSSSETVTQTAHGTKKTRITKKITTTTTTTKASSASVAGVAATHIVSRIESEHAAGQFSVWNDHELLQWRVDFAAIRDVQLLSSGMYGEVWLAIYMSRHVAVKRMKKNLSGRGGAAVSVDGTDLTPSDQRSEIQHFVQEIKLHSRMDHPKIVRFIGVAWTMESDIQSVVEYMTNGDLRSFLSSLQPKIESMDDDSDDDAAEHHWDECAIQIALDVTEALVYLHSLDPPVLHRDLKSRNVLLDDALRTKVTDFGVSRYHFDDDTHVNMTTNLGTARWAAPEVLTGSEANYTSAIDIYSLGVILSELDTWAVPFSEHVGVADSALLAQVIAGELKPRFRVGSPPKIVALARQCLDVDPKRRPTAVHVAYELRQIAATFQGAQDRGHGLGAAGRGSVSSSRSSMTAIGPAVAMSL